MIPEYDDIWLHIAHYFNALDLNYFKRTYKYFRYIGATPHIEKSIYHRLYERLYRIDPTLAPSLSQYNYQAEYQAAFNKVTTLLQDEVIELRKKFPAVCLTIEQRTPLDTLTPLARLEALNILLDEINIEIIRPLIQLNSNELDLTGLGITRFPERLVTKPEFAEYFAQLEELNCIDNNMRVFTLQNLANLKTLLLQNNKISLLKLNNLPELWSLDLNDNDLSGTLDLRDFPKIFQLTVNNNYLQQIQLDGLVNLAYLDLCFNCLTSLKIDSTILSRFVCSVNRLTSISIAGVDQLSLIPEDEEDNHEAGLSLDSNYLRSLPQILVDKFGKKWAKEELQSQHPILPLPPGSEHEQTAPYLAQLALETLRGKKVMCRKDLKPYVNALTSSLRFVPAAATVPVVENAPEPESSENEESEDERVYDDIEGSSRKRKPS